MKKLLYPYLIFQTLSLSLFFIFVSKPLVPNLSVFIIGSGSMSPNLSVDSLIVVTPQNNYYPGDIITFRPLFKNQFPTLTHRIHSIGGNAYVTKGDANQDADRLLVLPQQVIGKLVFTSHFLGKLYLLLKSKLGLALLIISPSSIIVYLEVRKIVNQINYKVA